MIAEIPQDNARAGFPTPLFESLPERTITDYARKLRLSQRGEARLRATLAAEKARLRRQNTRAEQQELFHRESCHRLLNGLQMVSALLSMQARTAAQAETAAQLLLASRRIGMIGHIHQRLNFLDPAAMVPLKGFLDELCCDFSTMLSADNVMRRPIAVEGTDMDLPAAIAGPLGFIACELITNAIKHGDGRITVGIARTSNAGYALSFSNDGSMSAKAGGDAGGGGLGMTIIERLARQIGAGISVDRGVGDEGVRVCVFSAGFASEAKYRGEFRQ